MPKKPLFIVIVLVQENIDQVYDTLRKTKLPFGAHVGEAMPLERYSFRDDPKESKVFWDVRKGLIPIVGGGREPGASHSACYQYIELLPLIRASTLSNDL